MQQDNQEPDHKEAEESSSHKEKHGDAMDIEHIREEERSDSSAKLYEYFIVRRRIITAVFAVSFIFIGVFIITIGIGPHTFRTFILEVLPEVWPYIFGPICIMIGFTAIKVSREMDLDARSRYSNFIDVDIDQEIARGNRRRVNDQVVRFESLQAARSKEDMELLKSNIHQAVREVHEEMSTPNQLDFYDFSAYFSTIIRAIEYKITNADRKASILLDRGMSYTRAGIIFYAATIVFWQVIAIKFGYSSMILYGILSCSLLFAFIEFLSAWFLRQYRHFVDTSTYFMKVKSIFDRYMLAFHLYKDADNGEERNAQASHDAVMAMLACQLQWPAMKDLKHGDVSFSKETVESLTGLIAALRNNGRESSD